MMICMMICMMILYDDLYDDDDDRAGPCEGALQGVSFRLPSALTDSHPEHHRHD